MKIIVVRANYTILSSITDCDSLEQEKYIVNFQVPILEIKRNISKIFE